MSSSHLIKALGKLGLAAVAINGLIGAGIFSLPAAAANQLGMFSPFMFLLCGLLMAPIILSFAKLSTYFSGTGGPILYANQAFGPFVGFQTGWLLYIGRVSALAANGHALVLYLSLFIPILSDPTIKVVAVTSLILLLAALNVIGVKNAMNSLFLVTFLKIFPLLLFILFGLTFVNAEQIFSAPPPQLEQMPSAMLLLVYAFIGFEGALIPGGEAKKPKRDMPSALLMTLIAATVLYFLIQSIVVSVLPTPIDGKAPLAAAGQIIGEAWSWSYGSQLLLLTAVISIFGNLLALMLAAPRMTYALSEQQQLPTWFGALHGQFSTPHTSTYFLAALAIVLAATDGFVWLAIFSSLARLIGYLICVLALPKLAREHAQLNIAVYSLTILAASVCIWLAMQADVKAWLYCGGFVALGSGLYYWQRNQLKKPS